MKTSVNPSKPKSSSQLTDTPQYIAAAQAASTAVTALFSQCSTWEQNVATQEQQNHKALYKLLEDCSSTVDSAMEDTTNGTAMMNTIKHVADNLAISFSGKNEVGTVATTLQIAFPAARSNKQRKSQYKIAVMAARKNRGTVAVSDWIEGNGGLEAIRRAYNPDGTARKPKAHQNDNIHFGDHVFGCIEGAEALEEAFKSQYTIHVVEYDKDTDEANIVCVVNDPQILASLNYRYGKKNPSSAPADSSTFKLKDLKASNDPSSTVAA
jgi:hypothetical protein